MVKRGGTLMDNGITVRKVCAMCSFEYKGIVHDITYPTYKNTAVAIQEYLEENDLIDQHILLLKYDY